MSQENVERIRATFEDFLAGRRDFGAGLLHPDVEWDSSDLDAPDISGVHHGIESVRQFWREWLAAWETVQFEYQLVDAGESVVVLIDQWMRGRSTGIELPLGKYAQIYTFRDGLVVHWKLYMSQSQALEAVGLSEQNAHADS
jgi:ketosteroid isomerase-like protein